ncbi:MAG: class I SAM-dependent methyltransferase [Acidimicrobiales bacterium]
MDAAFWDARYSGTEYLWDVEPNRWLVSECQDLPPGDALDLACGEGRNAVWLALQGWNVTGVDFAAVALAKARRLADEHGVQVQWQLADLSTWSTAESFDLVVMLYLHLPAAVRKRVVGLAVDLLRPAGTLLVVGHDLRNLEEGTGGPQDPGVLYTPHDIVGDAVATGAELVVERAETVERPVEGSDRPALDCLVRIRRLS